LYELTRALTAEAGLPAYEVSNHARPGDESRHNLAYWRYQPYCGVGPGAHGRRDARLTQRHRKPENWLAAVTQSAHGIQEEAALSARERAAEALLMGLRLNEGVDLARVAALSGCAIETLIVERRAAVLEDQGLLAREDDHLRVTPAGMLLLEAILAEIVSLD
jgi:oxygen-independent coproporphyrinogen-3 oxidase